MNKLILVPNTLPILSNINEYNSKREIGYHCVKDLHEIRFNMPT